MFGKDSRWRETKLRTSSSESSSPTPISAAGHLFFWLSTWTRSHPGASLLHVGHQGAQKRRTTAFPLNAAREIACPPRVVALNCGAGFAARAVASVAAGRSNPKLKIRARILIDAIVLDFHVIFMTEETASIRGTWPLAMPPS